MSKIVFFCIPAHGHTNPTLSIFVVWLVRYIVLNRYIKLKHNFFVECISYILLIIQLAFAYSGNRFVLYQIIIMIVIITLYVRQIKKIIFTAFRFLTAKTKG